ncbi:response regulator transcription factor [Pseudonocardia phyllosphaerae]|uniref:response regulator transcription factor n=1 Tax=Pseudonocardia phyllosphaerae TaxID=3390502 RepID=UPI00397C9B37
MRVTVAEDAALMRAGLVALLERFGHEVVAAVGDAPALIGAVGRDRPDLVLADVRMPPGHTDDGLRAAVALRAADPGLPVLVLSQYVEPAAAEALLDSGSGNGGSGGDGVGYLLKDRVADVTAFATALERVAAGGTVLDPEVVARLVRRRRDPVGRLSPREHEVLGLMAQGRSNTEIAAELVLSDAAVNKHVRAVFTKLDLPAETAGHRRVLAVLAWLRSGG